MEFINQMPIFTCVERLFIALLIRIYFQIEQTRVVRLLREWEIPTCKAEIGIQIICNVASTSRPQTLSVFFIT